MDFQKIFERVLDGVDLGREEVKSALEEIIEGKVPQAKVSGFLIALRMKGETPEEIAYFAEFMRDKAIKVEAKDAIDMCGTGGDGKGTLNISTLASFVVAAAGVPVAKHGNRAVSSGMGSADLVEAFGLPVELEPNDVVESIRNFKFGFIFAPKYHPAMKSVMPVRRELGVRTIFNILGPLCNPAFVMKQLLGVFSPDLLGLISGALTELGTKRAFVVYGEEGLDEVSISAKTFVVEVDGKGVKNFEIIPEDFGIKRVDIETVKVKSPEDAKEVAINVLSGEDKGPRSDIVALNAGFGLVLGGVSKNIKDGYKLAKEILLSGKALKLVEEIKKQYSKS